MMQSKYTTIYAMLFVVILLVVLGIFIYRPQTTIEPASTLGLSPTQSAPSSANPEPLILQWRNYKNDTYNFSIDVPKDWHEQEYAKANPTGGTLVAFSPDSLPCKTCTYFKNGYYSVRVYNMNSDPDLYTDFDHRMKNPDKNQEYKQIAMGDAKGVISASTIAIEKNGYVYEISLDTNNGNTKITDSKLFQKILSTFSFTGLVFN